MVPRFSQYIPLKVLAFCIASLLAATGSSAATGDLRLVQAAKEQDRETVRSILKQNPNVNVAESDGSTALAWAAHWDDLQMADLLIAAGAHVDTGNVYGVTPLRLACTNGSAAMVGKLLNSGANATTNVLMECAKTGNLDAVKALLSRELDINGREPRRGQTALMWAVAAKHPEVARLLIEHGADVNIPSKDGFTPLMFAAQQGDMKAAEILLAAGAKVNDVTPAGDTPLLIASASGNQALAIFLLDHGADPNAADEYGFTALHFAAFKGLVLINRVRVINTASPYLVRPNMLELTQALLKRGADPNARVKKLGGDKLLRVTDTSLPPGSVSPVGATAFLMAAVSYDAGLMRILVAGGANPLLTTEENVTAVMLAAGLTRWRTAGVPLTDEQEASALEAVKLGLDLGIDVNAADTTFGLTALHGAASNGSNKIIQLLVEKGANLEAKDKAGQTALAKAENLQPKGVLVHNLIPVIAWPKTADLLLKLGAVPVNAGPRKSVEAATAGQ